MTPPPSPIQTNYSGEYGESPDELHREKVTARQGFGYRLQIEPMRAADLMEIAEELEKATNDLYRFKKRFGYARGQNI